LEALTNQFHGLDKRVTVIEALREKEY
jgi:hypothetical protein